MKDERVSKGVRLNVVLNAEDTAWLDRAATGTVFDRSKVIRLLLAGLRASGLSLERFGSELELGVVLTCGLRGAAAQFPQYTQPKDESGSVGQRCVP